MEEASAAELEELRLGAVSQGKEWLSRSLSEMSARQLRVLLLRVVWRHDPARRGCL